MALAPPPTTEAEAAIRRLKEAVAAFLDARARSVGVTLPAPRLYIRRGSYQRQHAEDALLRLVAIGENYVLSALASDVAVRLPPGGVAARLWNKLPNNYGETWKSALEAWADIFQLKIAPTGGGYDVVHGYVEARNAIAHGLGTLTPRQQRQRVQVTAALRRAGLTLRNDSILVQASDVESCSVAVQGFLLWLDGERQTRNATGPLL